MGILLALLYRTMGAEAYKNLRWLLARSKTLRGLRVWQSGMLSVKKVLFKGMVGLGRSVEPALPCWYEEQIWTSPTARYQTPSLHLVCMRSWFGWHVQFRKVLLKKSQKPNKIFAERNVWSVGTLINNGVGNQCLGSN